MILHRVLVPIVALALAPPAAAQNAGKKAEKFAGKYGVWEAHRAVTGGETVCFVATTPERSSRKVTGRGEVALMVSHWPKDKINGQVKLAAGYTLKKNSMVELRFAGRSYSLWTKGRNGWASDAKMDRAIVRSLEAGKKLSVVSRPVKGAAVTDTFSLDGFTKAWEAARKACGK